MDLDTNIDAELDRAIENERTLIREMITRTQNEMDLDRATATYLIWYADSLVSERLSLAAFVEGAVWYEALALRSTPGPFYNNVPEDDVARNFHGFQQFVERGTRIGTAPPLNPQRLQRVI